MFIGSVRFSTFYTCHLQRFKIQRFQERPPGLIQHVLTVLVLGPGCCSCTGFHLRLGASDCSPGLAFCFMGPWTFAWICCPQLLTTHAKTGHTAHAFTAQAGQTLTISGCHQNKCAYAHVGKYEELRELMWSAFFQRFTRNTKT